MAARHAAWKAGNGSTPSQQKIREQFFYRKEFAYVKRIGAGTPNFGPAASQTSNPQLLTMLGSLSSPGRIYNYSVSYEAHTASPAVVGLSRLNAQFPFMPSLKDMLPFSVHASCQWDDVGEPWKSKTAALMGIFNSIMGLLSW